VPTPLYPTFEKRIADATARLLNDQVEPWFFMHKRLSVKRFDGRLISYEGVQFEGSPRHVFWSGYIDPFLQDLIVQELAAAVAAAKEREVDARELLPEVQGLLFSNCRKVLDRMLEVDRRLRGHGYPENVAPRNIESELETFREFLARHVSAEVQMWKPRPAYERWYERNKFWVWAVGLAVGIAGLAVKFL
jgi:hypothetical protein